MSARPRDHEAAPNEGAQFISKTQRKKAMHALQDAGEQLVTLPAAELAKLDLPEALAQAVDEARRITKHEARRRQMQYIGKLMRRVDAEPILTRLAALHDAQRADAAAFQIAERWRERLLAEVDAIDAFCVQFPHAPRAQLAALCKEIRADADAGRAPKRFRELFRCINDTIRHSS